jgi:excisionase family DNA binding protein
MKRPTKVSDPPGTPEFLSTGEVARLFGVSPSAVARWARTGSLRAVRTPGGHYRFRAREVHRVARAIPAAPRRDE